MYVQSVGVRYSRELQLNLFLCYRSSELLCVVKSPLFDVCGFRTDLTNAKFLLTLCNRVYCIHVRAITL